MKPEWKAFLADYGAEFEDAGVAHFGNPEREHRVVLSGSIIADLSHYGLIGICGDDANAFLQSQFINDVSLLNESAAQLSGWCSPKGRLLALFLHFVRDGRHHLRLPAVLVEPTLARLRKYVLRSKVQMEDANDALARFGLSGPQADAALREALGAAPETPWGALRADDITAIRIPGIHPRFELHGELAPMQGLWEKLNVRSAPVGQDAWTLLNVMAGLPEVHAETIESFLPQAVDLHLLDGLSFRKGCYPGQEVVARTQYLGKLKRRMYRLDMETVEVPPPGTAVVTPAGEEAGEIVEAALHPDGHAAGLAVLTMSHAEAGDLRVGVPDGAAVSAGTIRAAHEPPSES